MNLDRVPEPGKTGDRKSGLTLREFSDREVTTTGFPRWHPSSLAPILSARRFSALMSSRFPSYSATRGWDGILVRFLLSQE